LILKVDQKLADSNKKLFWSDWNKYRVSSFFLFCSFENSLTLKVDQFWSKNDQKLKI
jgi:hypothetical protein